MEYNHRSLKEKENSGRKCQMVQRNMKRRADKARLVAREV